MQALAETAALARLRRPTFSKTFSHQHTGCLPFHSAPQTAPAFSAFKQISHARPLIQPRNTQAACHALSFNPAQTAPTQSQHSSKHTHALCFSAPAAPRQPSAWQRLGVASQQKGCGPLRHRSVALRLVAAAPDAPPLRGETAARAQWLLARPAVACAQGLARAVAVPRGKRPDG